MAAPTFIESILSFSVRTIKSLFSSFIRPTLHTEHNERHYRNLAQHHATKRKEYFAQSQKAYLEGNKIVARNLSGLGMIDALNLYLFIYFIK